MDSHDVTEYTGYLIRRAQQAHVAAWQREVSAEVTSMQFGVLNVLARTPGASPSARPSSRPWCRGSPGWTTC